MSHPARGPALAGIDGKASAAGDLARIGGTLLIIAALMGCQSVGDNTPADEAPWYQIAVELPNKDPARALKYYEQLLNMQGPELAGELENQRRSFQQDNSDLNRVQLAMLLSFPETGFRDDSAAISLLQPLVLGKEGESSPLRPLAALLYAGLADLRRADDTLQHHAVRLKEEQRRADALQSKLEALLEMEMRMIEREQASQPKSR